MGSIDVSGWEPADEEPLGTKPKQWVRDPNGVEWLWKESTLQRDKRHGPFFKGDDWSEFVAGRLGEALAIPVAKVELAVRGDRHGILSRSVLVDDRESLVHGNELLGEAGVGTGERHDRTGYTLEAVELVLEDVGPPHPLSSLPRAFDWFVGYLVLDALVGNTDRHQDNWGSIRTGGGRRLAPSFDHASCLGFQLSDAERIERLDGSVGRTVADFTLAAVTKFEGAPTPRDLVLQGLDRVAPTVRRHWSGVVEAAVDLEEVVSAVPADRMSEAARQFACAVFRENRTALSHGIRTMWP